MRLYVKYMVSLRCKLMVKSVLAQLEINYTYLANIFSEVKGITIQHFIILNKIERAKELLLYNELSLTEISYKLNYSSVTSPVCTVQKITGLTPTFLNDLPKNA